MATRLQSLNLTFALVIVGLSGCSGAGESPRPATDTTSVEVDRAEAEALDGTWRRTSDSPCAALYPLELEVRGPVYSVVVDETRPLGPLGGGDIERVDAETLKLMMPTDAMATYQYQLSGDELTLIDDAMCEVSYARRAPDK